MRTSTRLFAGGALGCALVAMAGAAVAAVQFTPDGFVIVDGQPRLILGLYELPQDDAVLQKVADNGINLVRASSDKQQLDRLQQHGLRAWIPLGGQLALPEGDAPARAKLEAAVKQAKDHPALLCWEGPDEALWMEWFKCYDWLTAEQPKQLMDLIQKAGADHKPEDLARWGKMLEKGVDYSYRSLWKESEVLYDTLWKELGNGNPHPELQVTACIESAGRLGDALTRGWECVWSVDKDHVFWQNHAPGNAVADLRHYNRAVHAAGCDIYPAPFNTGVRHGSGLPNVDLTGVGDFTDHMRAGAPGKACWMVLQGFGWTDIKDRFARQIPSTDGVRPTTRRASWRTTR